MSATYTIFYSLNGHWSTCGATETPVLDFVWRLTWVLKARWIFHGLHNTAIISYICTVWSLSVHNFTSQDTRSKGITLTYVHEKLTLISIDHFWFLYLQRSLKNLLFSLIIIIIQIQIYNVGFFSYSKALILHSTSVFYQHKRAR